MMTPPSVTETNERRKNRCRIHASATSPAAIAASARSTAAWY